MPSTLVQTDERNKLVKHTNTLISQLSEPGRSVNMRSNVPGILPAEPRSDTIHPITFLGFANRTRFGRHVPTAAVLLAAGEDLDYAVNTAMHVQDRKQEHAGRTKVIAVEHVLRRGKQHFP